MLNLLTDDWICLNGASKTNIDEVLDIPVYKIFGTVTGYQNAIVVFMLLKNYLKNINENDFINFFQTPIDEFISPKEVTIDQLVYNQPRENTKKRNTDFFIKRGMINCLCEACATQSLFVTALFGGPCGVGYSTSSYCNKLLMFKNGETIREIIKNNKIEKKYSFNEIFSNPYKIKFINTVFGECSLCGKKTNCYTHFLREPAPQTTRMDNLPLVAKNKNGEPFFYRNRLANIQLVSKINDGSIVLPENINPTVNDEINAFSILYNKAKPLSTEEHCFCYSDVNLSGDIYFLSQQIKTFSVHHDDDLQYEIAMLFEIYLKNNSINESAIKIMKRFVPSDITALRSEKQKSLAVALNRVVSRYQD
ncbi:hypothetical protein A9G34_01095 [Gilliamella sp. Choc4-2]|uniref:hypothetical protein n=1 Tax=Gilliamella sp. Choc4-2 TaxID=3120237 RepID=UPI00080E703C|nr:hypothetical protein [Gilliamella apicola]OCG45727.1 hypothetical protein A9G34_01095 [Gilliamella apicola]